MSNTIYTIFLFGLPLLICIIVWRTVMALIQRFWPKASDAEQPGCLNFLTIIAMGALFFFLVNLIIDNYATTITVRRDDSGEIKWSRTHNFAPGMKIDGQAVPKTSLRNDTDIPLYIYSETYGNASAAVFTGGVSTYTVTCAPGQTIPVLMSIDYYFRPAPQSVSTDGKRVVERRWVLDSVVPYDYVIPVAPNAPVITGSDKKNDE